MTAGSHPTPSWQLLPNAPASGTLVGRRDDLRDGEARLQTLAASDGPPTRGSFSLLLLRSGAEVTAYANRCAHFGVPLAQQPDQLIYEPHSSISCNVHYARYRWSDGVCDRGDCVGEALQAIPLSVATDGTLRIGTGSALP